MASKLVTEGAKKNVSQLIKAMKGWNSSNFFTDPPKGVFGSEATIQCNGAVIKSSDLDIDFTIPFDDDLESNEAEISIYNLSDTTISRLAKGKAITVTAGFKGDTGVVFSGYIDKRTTTYEGTDRKTTLKCLDRLKETELDEITYKAGTKASTILRDLISRTGTQIEVFKVRRDHTFKDEQKVDGNLMQNIKKYSETCGVSTYVSKGKVYCRWLKEADGLDFTLSEDTGLINSPQEFEEELSYDGGTETITGWECESLLQHRFSAGGRVKIKSRAANGDFRIQSGTHTFSAGEAVTKIRVF